MNLRTRLLEDVAEIDAMHAQLQQCGDEVALKNGIIASLMARIAELEKLEVPVPPVEIPVEPPVEAPPVVVLPVGAEVFTAADFATTDPVAYVRADAQLGLLSADSGLHSGRIARGIAAAIESNKALTPAEVAELEAYLRKAVLWIWSRPNGWGVKDIGNNYHYSFVLATVWAERVLPELDGLENEKLAALLAHYQNTRGGGSQEGTGYGVTLDMLFGAIHADSDDSSIFVLSEFAADTIHYWVHATCPDFKHVALFGDQPLKQSWQPPVINDRVIILMLMCYASTTDETAKGMARWWLSKIGFKRKFAESKYDVYLKIDTSGELIEPATSYYYSEYTGHSFWRSGWGADAYYFTSAKKPMSQSHNLEGCGAVNVWVNGKWLTLSQSAYSRDGLVAQSTDPATRKGLETGTFVQNMIRFVDVSGKTIQQRWTPDEAGNVQYVDGAAKWVRIAIPLYDGYCTTIDTVATPLNCKAILQWNVRPMPAISGNTATVGNVQFVFQSPPKVEKWSDINPAYGAGYRLSAEYDASVKTIATEIRKVVA